MTRHVARRSGFARAGNQSSLGRRDGLDRAIRDRQHRPRPGRPDEAQLHEELVSGNLEQKLRELNPEAGSLLDDIADSMKNHPNADSLPNLLNGMVGSGR